jgi:hypothetical protein
MAVGPVAKPGKTKFKSAGAARSPLLGIAMFSPAVLYIVLLIGLPFLLAIFYAFSWRTSGGIWSGWTIFAASCKAPVSGPR